MGRLKVNLSGLELDNPIIPASGTFGFGKEFNEFYDINELGSFSCKGTTLNERYGNELPRIAECNNGMINAVGLQNPGIKHVVEHELKDLAKFYHKKILANVSGFSIEEYVEVAKEFDKQDIVGIIELNISCPNVKHGGMSFGTDPKLAYEVTKAVKEAINKPLYVKLSPNVTDIKAIAKAVIDGGADGIVAINTLLGSRFDIRTGKPIIYNVKGGFSGPCIKPIALRCINEIRSITDLPIIGCGGIENSEDVLEMIAAGANAVEVGAMNLVDPYASYNIVKELENTLDKYQIDSIESMIKRAKELYFK